MQPSELEAAISQQSWEWLLDVARRLEVAIEVIDARDVPLLPIPSTPIATAIRRIVAAPSASLNAAISNVRRSGTPTSFAVDGFHGLCVGLSSPGVLLIARTLVRDESAAECLEDLGCLAAWLTGGIDAALANPAHTISEEPYRISSLTRILGDAAASASPRRVLGAFVEALGVWDNVRIRGYAAGANAGFFHVVSPVGTVSTSVPAHIEDHSVPLDPRMVRLGRPEADRLGFASEPGTVLMLPLFTGASHGWLLVFSGAIDAAEQGRLTFYSEILCETLEDAFDRLSNQLSAVMPHHRLGPSESLESGAGKALEHLTAAIGGHEAALVVTTVTGIRALALGNTNLLHIAEQDSQADRLLATSSDTASVMTVVVARRTAVRSPYSSARSSTRGSRFCIHGSRQPSAPARRRTGAGNFNPSKASSISSPKQRWRPASRRR